MSELRSYCNFCGLELRFCRCEFRQAAETPPTDKPEDVDAQLRAIMDKLNVYGSLYMQAMKLAFALGREVGAREQREFIAAQADKYDDDFAYDVRQTPLVTEPPK